MDYVWWIIPGILLTPPVGLLIAAVTYRLRGTPSIQLAIAQVINICLCRVWYRVRIVGPCTVPPDGPVIITANHISSPDPLFLVSGCPRRLISWMIAGEYANLPLAGYFVRLCKCIPVRRDGADVAATKQALRRLRDGEIVGIFIQGRIPAPGQTIEPKHGVAMLALRSRATVIPAHISGAKYCDGIMQGFLTRHRVRVQFGPPVELADLHGRSDRATVAEATQRIYNAICSLDPETTEPRTSVRADAVGR